ncbi:forkhead box protein R1 isoform X2 [Ambystoma mexicanum]|uniref:forkhead box protein R1 isoform X2 n=1 Tax=Ambystoma mexicanum TaxID=8296 RepID=UPI0037E86C41
MVDAHQLGLKTPAPLTRASRSSVSWPERAEKRVASKMFLRFQNRDSFEKMHLRTGLEEWDMEEELKLAATTDQYFPGCDEKVDRYMLRRQKRPFCAPWISPFNGATVGTSATESDGFRFQTSLWLLVNPGKVCTLPYSKLVVPKLSVPVTPSLLAPAVPLSAATQEASPNKDIESEGIASSSSEGSVTEEDDSSSSLDFLPSRGRRTPSFRRMSKRRLSDSRKTCIPRSADLSDDWPRPPINYCILISVALRSSPVSLNVQQIYNFVREHFPFFRTAPEGWKNTVRHNLCFSSSFQKTLDIGRGGSKRKSCLWKLTNEGRRKFKEEMESLPEELVCLLRDSMYKPGLMGVMFDL